MVGEKKYLQIQRTKRDTHKNAICPTFKSYGQFKPSLKPINIKSKKNENKRSKKNSNRTSQPKQKNFRRQTSLEVRDGYKAFYA